MSLEAKQGSAPWRRLIPGKENSAPDDRMADIRISHLAVPID
jgi:hypothetical protein